MIETTMSNNVVCADQKKRNNQSGCDITKYFTPSANKVINSLQQPPEDVPDYFKRNCTPLDLSQPTVFSRSSIQPEMNNKWISQNKNENSKDEIDRFDKQIFELDSRMCREMDSKGLEDEEIIPDQRLYDTGLARTINDAQNNLLSLPAENLRNEEQQSLLGEKSSSGMINAVNVIMANDRSLNTQKEESSCANYLYAESQAYKWVPEFPPTLDDIKTDEKDFPQNNQPTIQNLDIDEVSSVDVFPQQPEQRPEQGTNPPQDDGVEVISYEDFLKSEGISVPSKDKIEPPVAEPVVEPVVKKQSNIRRFFTRVPRTVEVKFDHKRLVTVTAVVHPQPQSPRKLPVKKVGYKRQSPRRAQRAGTKTEGKQTCYNTRQRKSNVVVDTEEIDLSIEEVDVDNKIPDRPKKRFQRKFQEKDEFEDFDGGNVNGSVEKCVLRPRLGNELKSMRKSARLNPPVIENGGEEDESKVHKPLRSIYTSSFASGLRIKFTRIGRKHHHHHHHHHNRPKKAKNIKFRRALKLLQKAKESSVPREVDSGVRRSPRQSSVMVRKAMEGAARAEEMRQARITAQRLTVSQKRLRARRVKRRLKMIKNKNESVAPPETATGKTSQGAAVVTNATKCVVEIKKNILPPKKARIIDSSKDKAKEEFLNSGLPQQLQQATSSIVINNTLNQEEFSLSAPPIHVQQKDVESFIWKNSTPSLLRKERELKDELIKVNSRSENSIQLGILSSISGKISECYKSQVDRLASFSTISKRLPPAIVRQFLKEASLRFPNFSAFKLYRRYKLKRKRCLNLQDVASELGVRNNKKRASDTEDETVNKKLKAIDNKVVDITGKENCTANPTNTDENSAYPQITRCCHWQWTDKYQPTHSADVIGNGKVMRQLRQWLVDWKEKCKIQANRKNQSTPKKNGNGKGSWNEDDSDFELSDNNDEDSNLDSWSLHNTMLLSGPTGVGKTAAVYALAEELEYKVFEVNATSKRVGKQILTQLQEATQSHQVMSKAKLIKSFFEPKRAASQGQTSMKTETKAARKEYSQDLPEAGNAISLVLFEDVDLMFEEDEGFIQAVNTFMATTKRPIILTTSDVNFTADKIKGRCEELKFEIPCATLIATYLQILCLAENIRTEYEDLVRLVEFNRGDVRRSLLELQYWLMSGGDPHELEDNASKSRTELDDTQETTKNANSVEEPDSTMSSLLECPQDESSADSWDSNAEVKLDRIPAIHRGCFQQIHGICVSSSIPLLASLQTADVKTLTILLEQCDALNISLTLSNLPHLLSLPTCTKKSSLGTETATSSNSKSSNENEQFRKVVCSKTVRALSRLQDNLSWVDANLDVDRNNLSEGWWKWWYREPQPSELDVLTDVDSKPFTSRVRELHTSVAAASTWTCSQALQKVLRSVALHGNQCLPYMTVPAEETFVSCDLEVDQKLCTKHLQCARSVEESLSPGLQSNRRNLIVDYFPYIRNICQAEKLRQATNTKRGGRFLHYLDSVGIPSNVLSQLSEDFP